MLKAEGILFAGLARSDDRIVDVYAGSYSGFARTASGAVFAWGLNKNGQLATGDRADVPSPVRIAALSGRNIVDIAGGDFHTLALTSDGDVPGYVHIHIRGQ